MKTHYFTRRSGWRYGLTLLLMLALVVSVLGCSSGTGKDAGASPGASNKPNSDLNKDEKVELTIWTTPTGAFKPNQKPGEWVQEDLVPEWNKLYPNVKIKVEMLPFEGISEKVTTAIASKTAPDIMLDASARTLAYAQLNALASLDDVIPKDTLETIKNNPNMTKMVSVNGKVVVMPFSGTLSVLAVNKSLWKDANAENLLPQDEFRTWTPEQFKAALKAVANKDKGVYGLTLFALNEQGDQFYTNTMAAYGVKLFSDDYKKFTASDFPESEQVLSLYRSLVDEGLVHSNPETLSAINALDYWKQRKNGMIVAGSSHLDIVKNGLKDGSVVGPHDFMYVNYPSPLKGKSALKSEVGFGVVFKSDPVKEKWAKRFLYWAQVENFIYTTAMKTFDPFGKAPAWTNDDPELKFLAKLMTKTNEWPIVDPGYGIKGFPEMRAAMFPEMQKMYIKQATPKQAMDSISKKFNDIITKYNK